MSRMARGASFADFYVDDHHKTLKERPLFWCHLFIYGLLAAGAAALSLSMLSSSGAPVPYTNKLVDSSGAQCGYLAEGCDWLEESTTGKPTRQPTRLPTRRPTAAGPSASPSPAPTASPTINSCDTSADCAAGFECRCILETCGGTGSPLRSRSCYPTASLTCDGLDGGDSQCQWVDQNSCEKITQEVLCYTGSGGVGTCNTTSSVCVVPP